MGTQHPDWRECTDAAGEKYWTLEHLGHFAAVTRFGQAWEGRVWPQNDDDPGLIDFFATPAIAMATMELAIEASVRAAS
jgi:hypothetical protein